MKLDSTWQHDRKYHQYCFHCRAETVERTYEEGRTYYYCTTCRQRHERSIVIDPAIKWWIADDGEYWHESAGVFVRDPTGRFLFFERTIYPFALTVPSGHVDADEQPEVAASRELKEEVGLSAKNVKHIASEDISGDSCRRGSDAHRWHAYLVALDKQLDVIVEEEGGSPVWLTLDQALEKILTFPVAYIINQYADELTRVTNYRPYKTRL
ncbi:NUDIX hydrolase [Actinomadura formosensis]|uniref:NUDIX hydrolase n=1 Tax=Actinomadura formosensis TaxID=60706 RepID=UPI0009FF0022|nr:NUDIX hydrolase [Actinomadura formosensis]